MSIKSLEEELNDLIAEPQLSPTFGLLKRFLGNPYIHARQKEEGGYFKVDKPLIYDNLDEHLKGDLTLGTYVIINPVFQSCKFVVFDFDDYTQEELTGAALSFGMDNFIVFNSGKKGWHIWQLFQQPVPAVEVFDYGQVVRERFKLAGYDLEAFPKQDTASLSSPGSLVKVPFGIHQETGEKVRPVNLVGNFFLDRDELVRFVEKETKQDEVKKEANRALEKRWIEEIFMGVKESQGMGRNNYLFRLVGWLRQSGCSEEFIYSSAAFVNTKCFTPPLEADEFELVVQPRKGV